MSNQKLIFLVKNSVSSLFLEKKFKIFVNYFLRQIKNSFFTYVGTTYFKILI